MKKSMVRKGLFVGIIVLFVGASVVPAISENIKNNDVSQFEGWVSVTERDFDF